MEFIFKDNCKDIIKMINLHRDNPLIQLLISSNFNINDLLKATIDKFDEGHIGKFLKLDINGLHQIQVSKINYLKLIKE